MLTRAKFIKRVLGHFAVAMSLLVASLVVGMLGYMFFEHLSWIDAFLNAAMLDIQGELYAGDFYN